MVVVLTIVSVQATPVVAADNAPFANGQQDGGGASDAEGSDRKIHYQIDFVQGDVIRQLGPEDSDNFYSDQGRLLQHLTVSEDGDVTQSRNREKADVETDPDCILDGDEDSSTITFTPANQTARITFEINDSGSCTGEFELALVGYCLPEGTTTFRTPTAHPKRQTRPPVVPTGTRRLGPSRKTRRKSPSPRRRQPRLPRRRRRQPPRRRRPRRPVRPSCVRLSPLQIKPGLLALSPVPCPWPDASIVRGRISPQLTETWNCHTAISFVR